MLSTKCLRPTQFWVDLVSNDNVHSIFMFTLYICIIFTLSSILAGARGLLRPGGILVTLSSYKWDPNRTPRNLWIPSGSIGLAERLKTDFHFIGDHEVSLFWRKSSVDVKGHLLTLSVFKRL